MHCICRYPTGVEAAARLATSPFAAEEFPDYQEATVTEVLRAFGRRGGEAGAKRNVSVRIACASLGVPTYFASGRAQGVSMREFAAASARLQVLDALPAGATREQRRAALDKVADAFKCAGADGLKRHFVDAHPKKGKRSLAAQHEHDEAYLRLGGHTLQTLREREAAPRWRPTEETRRRREEQARRRRREEEARRRREAEARAVLNAAALATSIAAKDAEQWARRGVRVGGADIQRQARYHARQCDRDNDATFVDAYVVAATGAFEDAEARAAFRNAAVDLARLARDRQNAEAAVISAFICEVLAACRREAAAAAIAEVVTANRKLTEIAGEVLMLVDAHGGTIGTNSLPIVYQKWYGKDLDYPGKLTTFLKDLPGVELIPRISPRFPSSIRRATAPAPAPAPSRSASPDPTAAPWTPPPPAACVPYPIYAYPPPAYFVPLPPPMPYGLPVPMPPMSNNPFVLQPIPWEQAGVAHDPVTAERPRPGRMSELVRQAQRERRREARRGAAQADVSK